MSEPPTISSLEPEVLRSKTFMGVVWLVMWRLLTRIVGLGSTLVLARVLLPGDFGLLGMATAFSASMDALSVLGLGDALVRRRGEGKELYDTAFTLQLARSLVTASLLLALSPVAASWFNEPRLIPVLAVLAAASAISGFENIGIVEFRRALRFDVQFKLLLWPRLFQVMITIILAILLHSYWALLWGILATKISRTALTYWFHPHRPKLQLAGWRELVSFSFWTWATGLASLVWDRSDPFVLGPRLGATSLGLYLVANDTALLPVTEVVIPASDALSAGFAAAQKDGRSSVYLAPKVATTMMLLLTPFIMIISCASGDIVAVLLGPKWQAAQPLVAIMVWQCLMSPFSFSCSAVLVANGFVRHNFVGNLTVSVIKLALLLVMVRLTQDLALFAAASAICVALESIVFIVLLKHAAGVDLREVKGGLSRIAFSCVVTLIILATFQFGWTVPHTGPLASFSHGLMIGVITMTSYAALIAVTWKLAGSGDGPEKWAITLIAPKLRTLTRKMNR
jgi:lipopolysaccharide exporter